MILKTLNISKYLILTCLIFSCQQKNTVYKEIKQTLKKSLNIEFSEETHLTNGHSSLEEIRQKHPNLSIVYLQNSCAPCYPKFIQWLEGLSKIDLPDNYSVLFIIQGYSYQQFLNEVNEYIIENLDAVTLIDNPYPVLMDPNFEYIASNISIPQWIIDRTVLIDKDNRIRLVGAPWANDEMTKLFYKTCNN